MAKTTRKLGKLSLAILENFVESKLGKDFVEELRRPSERAGAIRQALEKTEERFKAEYKDRDLSKAMFVDLSQKDYPPLKEAIGKFYDHPTDPGFSSALHEILLGEFKALAEERVNRAVDLYLELLTEELALVDETFRENARALADLRMVSILRRVEILLAQKPQQPEIAAFRALHQLPSPPADFTGREEELKQLLAGLSAGRAAAISGLTGLGGIGKTALGLVVAHKLADQFPDAQIFLDLKGTATPLAPTDFMRHVILSFEPTADLRQADETQLAALYHSLLAGKKALLFLDNARSAEQVRPLLPPETCGALVTSRWNISLPGLHPLRLDVLPEAEAIGFLLTLCARIGDVAAEIAKLCGYLPLALRIAGNFLAENEDWKPQEYAARLSDRRERLKTLRDPEDPALDLEAAFELSYQQLPEGEQKYWRMLAVFPASFRREAAAAVWELEESLARELLSKLHRMSLLDYLEPSPLEGGRGSGEGGGRYSLHDLLADFALARMSKEENFDSHLRHAQYYMNVMGQADALYLKGRESILQGLKSFDAEWAHIQVGQAWAAENTKKGSETSELAMLYPDAGTYCLDLRLTPQQRIGWLMAALEAAQTHGNKSMEGNHLGNLGLAYAALGETRKAIEYHEQYLAIAREIGDRRGEGNALGNLGNAYADLGDARKAIEFYEKQLVIVREIGDRRGEGNALGNLAAAYVALGDIRKAIEFASRALVISHQVGDLRSESNYLNQLGIAHLNLGQLLQSAKYLEQALQIAREIGDRRKESEILTNLGLAYSELGEPNKAITMYVEALEIGRQDGNSRNEGSALGNLGAAYAALGETRKAIAYYEQALVIVREIGDRRGEGTGLGNLGLAYAALGDARKAIQFYEQQLVIAREIGDRRGEGNALGNLGSAYYSLGDARKAIGFYEQALAIAREIGDRRGEALESWNLGLAYKELGDLAKAIKAMQVRVDFEREIGHPDAEKDAAKVAELKQKL